jgi:hypothetical protein
LRRVTRPKPPIANRPSTDPGSGVAADAAVKERVELFLSTTPVKKLPEPALIGDKILPKVPGRKLSRQFS